ncbi:MAG: histidine--tRNA ligase [Holosporaceae bacterium]|jgi:histidyl-tRNA synthetase|nr:histidine--tRNA ligase [Holosporaceae bacterium]
MKSDISGFPEFLPNEQIAFNKVVDSIRGRFESYGFVPMDTAAVERVSTLLAKGNDNEIYGLYRLCDENSKKDLGLRFDLTVPFARYVVSNSSQLTFPHRRYQIAPVWRGERPQYGRYRQFYQCDIDIVGDGELSLEYDAEVVALITETLSSLNLPPFQTKINNRKILSGFIKIIAPEEKVTDVIRLVDKSAKISMKEFDDSLKDLINSKENISKLKAFLDAEKKGENLEVLRWLGTLSINDEFSAGVEELTVVIQILKKLGIDDNYVKVSTKLARGLTYYTGTVFETTFSHDMEDVGSISGGGRYDNLTEMLSDKSFPGVGATIGVSRIVPKLIEKGLLPVDKMSPALVLVTVQNREFIGSYMKIASKLRKIGVKTEVYLQDKNLKAQLNYANKKGYNFVIIANEFELLEGQAILRNFKTKEQHVIRTEFIGKEVLELLK